MNWEDIKKEYETSDITLKALAEKHDIKLGTLKSRKSRDGWERDATKKDATPSKKVATNKKRDATPKTKSDEIIEAVVESDELTERQKLFCIYYVKSFNATQSAIKAGYSADTAHVQGPRLLGNVRVRSEIERMKKDMTQGLLIDAMDVLQKWVKIAFADVTDYLTFGQKEVEVMGAFGPIKDEDGNVITRMVNYVEFNESNVVDGTLITEVKQGRDGVSIKLADKMKALEKLSMYFDLFPDQFKRQIEEEKLKLEQRKIIKEDTEEEYEDDGFLDALDGKEVDWNEET